MPLPARAVDPPRFRVPTPRLDVQHGLKLLVGARAAFQPGILPKGDLSGGILQEFAVRIGGTPQQRPAAQIPVLAHRMKKILGGIGEVPRKQIGEVIVLFIAFRRGAGQDRLGEDLAEMRDQGAQRRHGAGPIDLRIRMGKDVPDDEGAGSASSEAEVPSLMASPNGWEKYKGGLSIGSARPEAGL